MIEFFFWEGCPSYERALEMLRDAMREQGVDQHELHVSEVVTDDDAARSDFPGSPTIRVNGVDVQDPGDQPRGLTCRVYRKRDGRLSPLPDVEDLRAAVAALSNDKPVRG